VCRAGRLAVVQSRLSPLLGWAAVAVATVALAGCDAGPGTASSATTSAAVVATDSARIVLGNEAAGYIETPVGWFDCSADDTAFQACDPTGTYIVLIQTQAMQGQNMTYDDFWTGIMSAYSSEDCLVTEGQLYTHHGYPVNSAGGVCGDGDDVIAVQTHLINDPSGWRFFDFEGPGGTAYQAYHDDILSSYDW